MGIDKETVELRGEWLHTRVYIKVDDDMSSYSKVVS